MGMKQYRVGKLWEQEVLNYYKKQGFSTIKLPTDLEGTMFDILAIKFNIVKCIECKHIKNDKLYYKSSGLYKKRDELDNFCSKGNSVFIYVKSDVSGNFVIDWKKAKLLFEYKGYVRKEDGVEWKTNIK